MIKNTIRELPVILLEIKKEPMNDEFIKTTKQKLSQGDVTSDIYSVCDDVLLYSERVSIPKTLQKRALKDFHMGHPGTNRMKSLMRSFVYWPSVDQDITNMVKTCKGCALAAKASPINHKPWPKSEQLWSRILTDYAWPLENFYYLIVVDTYSKWPEVLRCSKHTTATTINFLMRCLPVLVLWIVWLVTMLPSSLRQSSRNSAKPTKVNTSRPHSITPEATDKPNASWTR